MKKACDRPNFFGAVKGLVRVTLSDSFRTLARQLVTGFRSVIYDAAAAEFAAATTWTAPFLSHAGRWGRRQARTMEDWRGRWRGIAQRQGHRMILFDSAEFDEGEAARLMTTHWQRGDQEVERRP